MGQEAREGPEEVRLFLSIHKKSFSVTAAV